MTVVSIVGGSRTYATASGGKVYGYNNITSNNATLVAPANPQRQKLTFHNPSDLDIIVSPALNAVGGANAPTDAARGGGFLVYANGGTLVIEGECQGVWNALCTGVASNRALTVMDSNI